MDYKDYYKVLGIPKTATQQEISQRFRTLARQYHPDANPGDQTAEEKFKEINEAYQVLSDPDKRGKYDQFGQQWQQYARAGGRPEDFNWGQWRGGPGGRTVNMEDLFGQGGAGGFSDFFETLFGGGMGGVRSGMPGRARGGQNIQQTVEITLEEAFHGASRTFERSDGTRFEIKIPQGVQDGAKIRFSGKGAASVPGAPPGDLIVKVHLLPHSRFTRRGDDLTVEVSVDLYTALLGGQAEIPTIDKTVTLKIPPHTQNGQSIRLRGLGMPHLKNASQRGDLFAKISVQLPTYLTPEEQQLFEKLRALRHPAS